MRHRNAHRNSSRKRPQHPARGRTMQIQLLPIARVIRGNHKWLAIHHEADVAHKGRVENRMDGFRVILPSIGKPLHLRPLRSWRRVHSATLFRPARRFKVQSPGARCVHFHASLRPRCRRRFRFRRRRNVHHAETCVRRIGRRVRRGRIRSAIRIPPSVFPAPSGCITHSPHSRPNRTLARRPRRRAH